MNNTTAASTEDYLNALDEALSTVTPDVRATILEDVRGHIADALDSGQAVTTVLERLGSPEAMALSALAELGVAAQPAAKTTGADSSRRVLLLAAIAVAVLTAALFSHVLPHRSMTTELGDGSTQVGPASFAPVLLALIPVIAAVLPLILPVRMRPAFVLAAAIAGTALWVITSFIIGPLYLPLLFLLWAAAIVPWLRGYANGERIRVALRVAFTIAIVVPPVLVGANLIVRGFDVTWTTWAGALLSILLIGLFAAGVRAGCLVAAALGVGLMIVAVADMGMLFEQVWLAGGVYLAVGLSAFLTRAQRTTRVR